MDPQSLSKYKEDRSEKSILLKGLKMLLLEKKCLNALDYNDYNMELTKLDLSIRLKSLSLGARRNNIKHWIEVIFLKCYNDFTDKE